MHRRTMLQIAAGGVAALALAVGGTRGHATVAAGREPSLIIIGDTVRGGAGLSMEEAPFLACVQQNRFAQGSEIVFRMRVIDPQSGEQLTPAQISSMTLTLPDGSVLPFTYHPLNRGMSPDSAFILPLPIADDYPTGALDVRIEAVDRQGRSGVYRQFDSTPSLLQIVPKGQR